MANFSPKPLPPGPGRAFGSKNRITDAIQIMNDNNFNPIQEAINRYRDPKATNGTKDIMLTLLIKRVSPELRSIEMTGKDGTTLVPTVIRMSAPEVKPIGDDITNA